MAPNQNRRPLLLSSALLGGLTYCAKEALFVPAPGHGANPSLDRGASLAEKESFDPVGLGSLAGAAAASQLIGVPQALAAGAAVSTLIDNPLAHGAPGTMDEGVAQGAFEKVTFLSLLASTFLAAWRATVGSKQQQSMGGQPYAFWAMALGCGSIAGNLCLRWYESGHFPLSNMYESLSFLAWGVTAVTLFYCTSENQAPTSKVGDDKRSSSIDIAMVCSSPTALGIIAFATLSLPKELQKASSLVPALQSNWLMMHVSVVMMAYATLMFGSVLCMAVLVLNQPDDSPITALRNAATPAFKGIADGLSPQPQLATATAGGAATPQMQQEDLEKAAAQPAAMTAAMPARQEVLAAADGSAVTIEFSSTGSGTKKELTEDDKLTLTLDDLAYRSLLLGFGCLTVGIISGAVWANEAWGSYWSWDPKETWALIVWLVYAAYLHTRLMLGWDSRDSAKVGAFGFPVVWICYVGVNLMGMGLHSYGFFLK
eukprot:TRINITY_DN123423_c0_g1_i1.p1 TRINITY_DN123423_c0_g1~~TRINITY_DN123423_c0_g1_i1.p1  ORF type:complete len:485 (+),score=112.12 TRINITY_DN123423_c0_g1_i1:107-1561(+)